MMYNPVTKEAFNADTGFVFQPCYMEHIFAEWPAEGETGPVIGHPYAAYLNKYLSLPFHINKSGVVTTSREGPDKHVFTDTYQVYGMFLADDGVTSTGFGIVSFSKTKMKAYKDWCTSLFSVQCNKVTPPLFANRARFTAVKKTNAKGTFYVYKIEPFKETWVKSLIDPRTERHLLVKGKEIMDNAINEKKKFGNVVVGVNDADELDSTSIDVPF